LFKTYYSLIVNRLFSFARNSMPIEPPTLYDDLLSAIKAGNEELIDTLCSRIDLYNALLKAVVDDQAVVEAKERLIDALCSRVSINITNAQGLSILAKFITDSKDTIEQRVKKARKLFDYRGAWLSGMVQGLAIIGATVMARQYCDDHKIPPIWYAWGLAYSGNTVALDQYFKEYGAVPDQALKTETTGIIAHAILTAAAIYGGQTDLAGRLRKKILAMDAMKEVEVTFPNRNKTFIKNNREETECTILRLIDILYIKSLSTIVEALGVMGNSADIAEFFQWMLNVRKIEGSDILSQQSRRDIANYLHIGLVKGGHNECIGRIIAILSADDHQAANFSIADKNYREVFDKTHFIEPSWVLYNKLRAIAQIGDPTALSKIFQDFANSPWPAHLIEAVEFSAMQFRENGYPIIAIAISRGAYSNTPHREPLEETTANILKGHTAMTSIRDADTGIGEGWGSSVSLAIPDWMCPTLTSATLQPFDYFPNDYHYKGDNRIEFLNFLPIVPGARGSYVADRLPRSLPLGDKDSAIHFLWSIPNDAIRKEVYQKLYIPIFGQVGAQECWDIARACLKTTQWSGVSFTAAKNYHQQQASNNGEEVSDVFQFLPAEIKFIIFSYLATGYGIYPEIGAQLYRLLGNQPLSDITWTRAEMVQGAAGDAYDPLPSAATDTPSCSR
jgi:hypothetical protein